MRWAGVLLVAGCAGSPERPLELSRLPSKGVLSVHLPEVKVSPDDKEAAQKIGARFRSALTKRMLDAGYRVVKDAGSDYDLEAKLSLDMSFYWFGASADVEKISGTWSIEKDGALIAEHILTEESFTFTQPSDEDLDQKAVELVNLLVQASEVAPPKAAPEPKAPVRRTVVAVFEIEDPANQIDDKLRGQITAYLSVRVSELLGFSVVPTEALRAQLEQMKRESFASCYDEACQIELGKAVAAEKSLSTKILKVGDTCALTATLFDLKTEATEKAASTKTSCQEAEILAAVDTLTTALR